jgi:hypothetical protein
MRRPRLTRPGHRLHLSGERAWFFMPGFMPGKSRRAFNEPDGNPMHPNKLDRFDTSRLNNAPRCQARSKRSGLPCKAPAVAGYRVCRMHGARGGAPEGTRNGNYRHGQATNEGRRIIARINYLGRMLRHMRREEKRRRRPGRKLSR